MSSHRHAGKKTGRGHKRAAPQRVEVRVSKPKSKASKYHHRGMSGLGGTQAEHEDRAREILTGAEESVASVEKMLRSGDCQRAHTILQAASVFVGRAEADYDAAVAASPWTPAGRAYSESLNRLESNLYAADSGVAAKLSRVANKFAAACVIKK